MKPKQLFALIRGVAGGAIERRHGSFVISSAAVQALPLLSAPIIARLYSPEAFGVYAIFFAVVTIIGSCASLALHNAILLEESDQQATQVAVLSILVTVLVSIATFVLISATPTLWLDWAFGPPAVAVLPWAALTVLLSGLYMVLYTWFIRQGAYPLLARNKVILGVCTTAIQIGIGLLQLEAIGFVIANMVGYLLAVFMLIMAFWKDIRPYKATFQRSVLVGQFRRHVNLPLYTVPATLINSIGSQIPEFFINKYYGAASLGQYSLANRVIGLPLTFISTSIQDIFRQKASEEFRQNGNCRNSFSQFFVLMAVIAVVILIPIIIIVPELFRIMFGSRWEDAGYLVRALVFLLAVRFVSSPLSYVWIIRGQQRLDMFWQIGLLVVSVSAFFAADLIYLHPTLTQTLFLFSGLTGFWYVVCLLMSRHFSR